jgi:DNA polymerase III epsilon subunit-like protein
MAKRWPWHRKAPAFSIDPHQPFAEQDFWVIDGEMSGFDAEQDELLSFAMVPIRNQKIQLQDFRYWLIQPKKNIPLDNLKIHGLTPNVLKTAIPKAQFIQECGALLEQQILVGHFVNLDWVFLKENFKNLGRPSPAVQLLDTIGLCQWLNKRDDPHGLQAEKGFQLHECCARLATPVWPEHHAAHDVLSCACLFLKLLNQISGKGYYSLGDLLKLK